MALTPALLFLAAGAALAAVTARVATRRLDVDFWWGGSAALGASAALVAWFLATGRDFTVEVFVFGVAIVTGAYWSWTLEPDHRSTWQRHLAWAAVGLAFSGLLALVAIMYRWWFGPAAILALLTAGLLANDVLPAIRALRGKGPARRAPPAQPLHSRGEPPRVGLRCASCGLAGSVPPAMAGKTLRCPRCAAPVRVTTATGRAPHSPPPAGGPRPPGPRAR